MSYLLGTQENLPDIPLKEKLIKNRLHGASAEMIELIESCLRFNPAQRSTIKDCLDSPIFDKIRKPKLEKESGTLIDIQIDYDKLNPEDGSVIENRASKLKKYIVAFIKKVQDSSININSS